MRLLGRDVGYDEPFWYFGRWEFLLHDNGWVIMYRRVQQWAGVWPRYRTFHRKRSQ